MKEKVPVPVISDQLSVAALVENEMRVRESVDREITLLREYRTRLTSDVVTGQLDVRAVAAGLPEVGEAPVSVDSTDSDESEEGETEEDA